MSTLLVVELQSRPFFRYGLISGVSIAVLVFLASLFIDSPYGKLSSPAYGIEVNPRLGWWAMELMATVSFVFFYFQGPNADKPIPMVFALLYLIHYANRGWYFPFSMRVAHGAKSSFSVLTIISGIFVTSLHGYLNATWYSTFCPFLEAEQWLASSPICWVGLVLYEVSFVATLRSEYLLRNLRDIVDCPKSNVSQAPFGTNTAPRYKIPKGFLFEYVSSPQYLTEITGFLGWAMMTLNPAGVVIFMISCANLIPRAMSTHVWYQQKFKGEYPLQRKALIPFFNTFYTYALASVVIVSVMWKFYSYLGIAGNGSLQQ